MEFPLYLRIPAWASEASLKIGDDRTLHPRAGEFYKIERNWSSTTKVELRFPMKPRASRRYNNALAIERGPLVYSLKIEEKWKRVNVDKPHRELPHGDWEVWPTSPWNYALDLDENSLEGLQFEEHTIGDLPFSPDGAPVSVKVMGIRINAWKLLNGSADEIPKSPVRAYGNLEELILIPYGCTNIRITEFPTLK